MSFFVDWCLLIIFGIGCALISRLKPFYRKDGFLFYYLCAIVLVVFYTVSVGMFCELGWDRGVGDELMWGNDNQILGSMNELFFELLRGNTNSAWGSLASLSPFQEYYLNLTNWSVANGVAVPTSTEFIFSSGFEFIKSGSQGAFIELESTIYTIGYIQPIWLNFLFFRGVPFNNLEQLAVYHPVALFGGICLFATYPAFLYIGTQLGYLFFGRKPGDKGILYLL